jgi:energy-coupling factor transport system ATP-binding protein
MAVDGCVPPDLVVIEAKQISFKYKSTNRMVLQKISLKIPRGQFVLLCGSTGSGKTSLIRAINGLIPHFYHGEFYGYLNIKGLDTCEMETPECMGIHVGTVFQIPENQLFSMNVERELAFSLEQLGYSPPDIRVRITKAIEMTGIQGILTRAPYELSGGEQQKVALASLLALEPEILVLDEPLSSLDPKSAAEVVDLLCRLNREFNKTILISEHRLEYIIPYVQRVLVMSQGGVILDDTPSNILNTESFFQTGLDIPPIHEWFMKKKQELRLEDHIPIDPLEKSKYFRLILEKMKIKSQSPTVVLSRAEDKSPKRVPIITIDNVSYSYDQKLLSDSSYALKNISLTVFKNEIVGIVGPNGAGKSTLIRCLNGLIRPQQGNIFIRGKNIALNQVFEIAKDVGLMFQNPDHQLFSSTVVEELRFSLKNLNLGKDIESEIIENTLQWLDLTPLKDESPFNISGGQKKKVSIASIICREPEILIFDEPTIGQDRQQKELLYEIIRKQASLGKTILIVSHDIDFLSHIASRLIVLKAGQILADGDIFKVLSNKYCVHQASLHQTEINALIERTKIEEIPTDASIFTIQQLEAYLKNVP